MSERTPEALRDFLVLMLGSQAETPLRPRGAEDIVNGATISALVEAFQATHPIAGPHAGPPRQPNSDPLAIHRQ